MPDEQETKPRRPPCERCGRRIVLEPNTPHCVSCWAYLNPEEYLARECRKTMEGFAKLGRKAVEKERAKREAKRHSAEKTVFGYIRVSTKDQADSGAGLAAQRQEIEDYYERVYKKKGYLWGGIFEDKAVSARKRPFADRPRAQAMMRDLDKGDVVVVSKLDRAFRRTRDLLTTVEMWQEQGVNFYVIQLGLDFSTAVGRLVTTIMGAVAEFEVSQIVERTRAAQEAMKKKGAVLGGRRPPYGSRVEGRKGNKHYVPDLEARRAGQRTIELRDVNKLAWRQIEKVLWREGIRGHRGRIYNFSTLRWFYRKEKVLQRLEAEEREKAIAEGRDPNDLDPLVIRHPDIAAEALAIPTGIPETRWYGPASNPGKQDGKAPEVLPEVPVLPEKASA
jgi:putative DNA-invertase from lambdoid prophage Rac